MKLKRIIAAALSVAVGLSMSACRLFDKDNTADLEGFDILKKAMESYNEQSSGGFEVYDAVNQVAEMKFIYWYDEVDVLTFYSEENDGDGGVYKEYTTGHSFFVEEDGVGKELPKSDERYKYYDRQLGIHPQTTDKVFYFSDEGIVEDTIKRNEDNSGSLLYRYDPKEAGMGIEGGKLESFSTEYFFDKNEVITHFVQKANGTMDSGEEFAYEYVITIIPESEVGPIDNPIKVTEQTTEE